MNKKLLMSLIFVFGFIFFVRTQMNVPAVVEEQISDVPAQELAPDMPEAAEEVTKALPDLPEETEEQIPDEAQEEVQVISPEPMEVLEQEDVKDETDDFLVDFDHVAKRKAIVRLVERGIDYLKKHTLSDACNKFTHTKDFIEGELYLFFFDFKGTAFAHGQQADLLWNNLYNLRDSFGTPLVQDIIQKAKDGGGWVTYQWRGAGKASYIKEVRKDGKSYAVGCGYYPHSKPDAVISLVKSAVAYFSKTIKTGGLLEDGFSPFSYPVGRFVYGDLYLYAFDYQGNMLAQGDRPGLIGTNAWNYKDSTGKYVNREIVAQLKKKDFGEGVWIDYISKRTDKKAYAEKVADAKGNNYIIACGYYPNTDRKAVVELVRRGYQYMKTHGKSRSARDFSDVRKSDYRFGDLFLVVFDMKGNVVAHGGNKEFVGKNHYDRKDEDGRYYVREIIQKAKEGGGWINIKINKSFLSAYYEKIDLGVEELVIGSGVYPVSKHETMILLAKSGSDFLRDNDPEVVFREFVNVKGKFIRGDISLFAFDTNGICYAYGDDFDLIWRNLISVTDDEGKPFVQNFINMIKHGSGITEYVLNGVPKVAYIQSVQKDDMAYIVGSSYYK